MAVGKTRTRWAALRGRELDHAFVESNAAAPSAIVSMLKTEVKDLQIECIAIASVQQEATKVLLGEIGSLGLQTLVIGRDCMPPLEHTLEDASTLGIDRALNAYAAWRVIGSACVVIDAGTAITVDFVDGTGVFHGGAIAPGVNMMLESLHTQTEALPKLDFAMPDESHGPFGRETAHAMQLGVVASARGLVRELVEKYAEAYKAYPRVIATGGDAHVLFDDQTLIERIMPDLQLLGIERTLEYALGSTGDEPPKT